jgi:penicillin amidase
MDDLVFAQGFVTAQDRLWQMDLLRRHAAGELAAILGPSMLQHDRLQRTLQLRTAADRAVAALPADQKHWLDVYARGVNASIAPSTPTCPSSSACSATSRLRGRRATPCWSNSPCSRT